MIEDARAFGYSEAAIAQLAAEADAADDDDGLAIHPENVTAVRWLLALQTQWRVIALTTSTQAEVRRTGLDYSVLDTTARLAGLEPEADDFTRLRILEAEALGAWAEERRR